MSPYRVYHCESGHDIEVVESMSERLDECPHCGKPVAPRLQATQRPIVRGGTPTHHKTPGV